MRRNRKGAWVAIFFLAYLGAVIWPVIGWLAEPKLLFGLPIGMVWAVAWILVAGVILAVYELTRDDHAGSRCSDRGPISDAGGQRASTSASASEHKD